MDLEKTIQERLQELQTQLRRIIDIGNRVAEELGLKPGELELSIRPSASGLRYRLRVRDEWFDLPRALYKRTDERIADLFREVMQARPVVLDHSQLIEAVNKLRPSKRA